MIRTDAGAVAPAEAALQAVELRPGFGPPGKSRLHWLQRDSAGTAGSVGYNKHVLL